MSNVLTVKGMAVLLANMMFFSRESLVDLSEEELSQYVVSILATRAGFFLGVSSNSRPSDRERDSLGNKYAQRLECLALMAF